MSRNIIIYGAGGLGREVLQAVRLTLCAKGAVILGFVDDEVKPGTVLNDAAVLGGGEYLDSIAEPCSVVIGFADPHAKEGVYRRLRENPLISFPNIVHPSARISDYARLGEGVVIAENCLVSVDAAIGDCVFLNYGAMIGHDAIVGNFTSIMPSAAISGNVHIGERGMIGVLSALKQGIIIGADCTIGMGSIVVHDVPDGVTVIGNPARAITKP
ncbi:MAG: acetyltransferase [Synergistaceae bacterium]|nr:acetyltransferase [Synergistaceae bacterium]